MADEMNAILRAENEKEALEFLMVDEDIKEAVQKWPSNYVASEYPLRLQMVKSLQEIATSLKVLVKQGDNTLPKEGNLADWEKEHRK